MDYPRARLFSTRRKENLLFSRVIHARFLLMQKKKENKQTKKDGEPSMFGLNRYKKKETKHKLKPSENRKKSGTHTHT